VIYDLFFKAAAETTLTIAADLSRSCREAPVASYA